MVDLVVGFAIENGKMSSLRLGSYSSARGFPREARRGGEIGVNGPYRSVWPSLIEVSIACPTRIRIVSPAFCFGVVLFRLQSV